MIQRVKDHLGSLPYLSFARARMLEEMFRAEDIKECLELGFAHGVSSAYIAQILEDLGRGHLTTVDRTDAKSRNPTIHTVLDGLGLSHRVTVHIEPRCLTWRLMRLIEDPDAPRFDFCYFDGGHSWLITGYAFFLVEKLLRPGGWMVFDDLDWSYRQMIGPDGLPDFMRSMPPDQVETPQVRKVFDLLVKPHPGFHNIREDGTWGFAQKRY